MNMCFLNQLDRIMSIGLCAVSICLACGCAGNERASLPRTVRDSLKKFHCEKLEPLKLPNAKSVPTDIQSFIDFYRLCAKSLHRYGVSHDDIVEIMGNPINENKVDREYEYSYPSCSKKNISILVWFDEHMKVWYLFAAARPVEYLASIETKERLGGTCRRLKRLMQGEDRLDTEEVGRQMRHVKKAFNEMLKTQAFTYRDVVEIMGEPSSVERANINYLDLKNLPYGNPYGPRHMWTVGYRLPLNEHGVAVLCFTFCETLGGCLGTVSTSWCPVL